MGMLLLVFAGGGGGNVVQVMYVIVVVATVVFISIHRFSLLLRLLLLWLPLRHRSGMS